MKSTAFGDGHIMDESHEGEVQMRRMLFCPVVALLVMAAHCLAGGDPPAYKLQPGVELIYETLHKSTGSFEMSTQVTAHLWVLHRNDDGSHRVLLRSDRTFQFGEEKPNTFSEVLLVDVAPDGALSNPTSHYMADPARYFPRLPPAADEQWEHQDPAQGKTTRYQRLTAEPGRLKLSADDSGPMMTVYGTSNTSVHVIDLERGLLVTSEHADEQTYAIQTKGTGTTQLKSTQHHDPSATAALAEQSAVYFQAQHDYKQILDTRPSDPAVYDQAGDLLREAIEQVSAPLLKGQLESDLATHETRRELTLQWNADQNLMIDKAAPDWELKDLAGNTHRLSDYRNKVVVLDFWYRGCGWCIRAMPQMNQLAADFRDQPVAILGINNDADVADARFVADVMELAYPTLLGPDIPQAYNIKAFPTLLLIDTQGIIREIHMGYSPDLREVMTRKINTLLSPAGSEPD